MRAVVVIPTLNACALLAEALASIDAQTVPVDVIVVDNASSDGTLELLATRFSHVTVVRNEENLGFGRAVNRGAAAAADADVIVWSTTMPCARPTSSLSCSLRSRIRRWGWWRACSCREPRRS